jgi:fructose-1,6-bisphosphatase I
MKRKITLGEFIIQQQSEYPHAKGEMSQLLSALMVSGKIINKQVQHGGLTEGVLGSAGDENVQGETQQKLDILANNIIIEAFEQRQEVCGIASEENEKVVVLEKKYKEVGKYVLLIDPLDGSSNIDVTVSVGTIFSLYRRVTPEGSEAVLKDFLQPGHKQVAAGYIIYGSSTMMVYSTGNGVNGFTLDPSSGVFFLTHPNLRIPETGPYYSVNEGKMHLFPKQYQAYIESCKVQKSEKDSLVDCRYTGSLVADFHRSLLKGGIYLYPPSTFHPDGKLRLLYECNPLAFLCEQAGGKAINGESRILDMQPTELHQRCPLVIGSTKMVEQFERMKA